MEQQHEDQQLIERQQQRDDEEQQAAQYLRDARDAFREAARNVERAVRALQCVYRVRRMEFGARRVAVQLMAWAEHCGSIVGARLTDGARRERRDALAAARKGGHHEQ